MRPLPISACIFWSAVLGWNAVSAQADIDVVPVWEAGDNTGLGFALIVDMAPGPDGAVYVLDELAPGFSLLAHDGAVIASISGQGRGPSEFSGPADIETAPDGSPVVLDVGAGRLSWYHRDGRGFRADSSWIPPVPLRSICYLNGRLFGLGTSMVTNAGLLHEFDDGHDLVRSFGLPDEPRDIPTTALGSGRLLCVDDADVLLFLPDVYGRVFAFSPDGRLLWEQSLPGYLQMTVEAGPGWIRYTAPKQGYTHMGTSLIETKGMVIAQYARVDSSTRRSVEAERVTSVLMALGDGTLISTREDLPRLVAGAGPAFFGFENVPVPRALRYRAGR